MQPYIFAVAAIVQRNKVASTGVEAFFAYSNQDRAARQWYKDELINVELKACCLKEERWW